jgi:putative transposase
MLFEEFQVNIADSLGVEFLTNDRTRTPAWLIKLVCAAHAGATSLAECRDLCEWFEVERRRATIHHWYQACADHYEREFPAGPDRTAVDDKQIKLKMNRTRGSTPQLIWI